MISAEELLPLLETAWLGRCTFAYEELASTSSTAQQLAADGVAHGTVVVAERQSAGRGRLGRSWHSPGGLNLYASAVLRPALDLGTTPLLGLTVAVGIAEAVQELLGRPPVIKWPNDLLYEGRKWCGILMELSSEATKLRHVIAGLGINVNATTFPAELAATATSLYLVHGRPLERAAVLAAVLNHLEPWIERLVAEGGAPICEAWLRWAPWVGQSVRVALPDGDVLSGEALGLDSSGALRLRLSDGSERCLVAGLMELPCRRMTSR